MPRLVFHLDGLLSFCIAQTKLTTMFADYQLEAGPLWNFKLFTANPTLWPQNWLDGIRDSCVYQHEPHFMSIEDRRRPPVSWFLEHGVPVFYPWRVDEERRSVHEKSMNALRPPSAMIEKALTDLFSSSSLPMSALVADVAMYCMRYLAANETHTILNLASALVCKGIKCCTLLGLRVSSRQENIQTIVKPFQPAGFRARDHVFTKTDFEAYVNSVEELVGTSRLRAGLLKGGIIARISRSFLNLDGALDGPSWEVTECRVGFIVPQGQLDLSMQTTKSRRTIWRGCMAYMPCMTVSSRLS